jgi:Raf kinase inhibitor-like YbhB/YbcL family protein
MILSSPAFEMHQEIPSKYTCEGLNYNPALKIADVPSEAKSLVLIIEDPDVPSWIRTDNLWIHWVIFNIPKETTSIEENSHSIGVYGRSTSGKIGYEGPCPPDRRHRYFFKLYALDTILSLKEGSTKEELLKAMQNHVVDATELIGTYEKHHVGED